LWRRLARSFHRLQLTDQTRTASIDPHLERQEKLRSNHVSPFRIPPLHRLAAPPLNSPTRRRRRSCDGMCRRAVVASRFWSSIGAWQPASSTTRRRRQSRRNLVRLHQRCQR
jgi:hypothetical protein